MTIKLELSDREVSMILYSLNSTSRDFAPYDNEKCKEYKDLESSIDEIRHWQWSKIESH